jgi:hypothetical protein
LIVRGIDLLGHPLEERTATLTLNLQGCRYFSKHHLPRNSWVTLEVGDGAHRCNVRARVAWIHRPHSIRDSFQVAIELERAENVWGLAAAPPSWSSGETAEKPNGSNYLDAAEASPELTGNPTEGSKFSMTSNSPEFRNNFDTSSAGDTAVQVSESIESNVAIWRERLASEMAVAQRQWDELLQSSLDRALQRLAEQLPQHAQHALRATDEKMAEQFAHLGQLLAQTSSEAQNALAGVKASIDQELWRARDTLENARQQTIERIGADAEARVAPHAARVPELVRELSGREEQIGEGLRLHRERLRQASDSTLREVISQMETTASALRGEFEAARVQALAKWNEEVDGLSARAGHAASESISRTSEWLQQETRERLQVLTEQMLATAETRFQEQTSKAAAHFATHLEGQTVFHLAQAHQQLDGVANDLTGETRTQLAEAAEAAASSFGQVLHELSAERTQQFNQSSENAFERKRQELEDLSRQVQSSFESDSAAAIERLRQQAASELESLMAEARVALAAESAAALDVHRTEREVRSREWTESLSRIAGEAVEQCNDRIQTAADAWTVASVRRLNEHGQNVIESLMRSADQALRDSASRMFEGLAAAMREDGARSSSKAASYAAAAPSSQDASSGSIPPPQENYSVQPGA